MSTVAALLEGHLTLEVECVDRLYLNGYTPELVTGAGLTHFLREHLGKPVPSPAVLGQITTRFRAAVKDFAGCPPAASNAWCNPPSPTTVKRPRDFASAIRE